MENVEFYNMAITIMIGIMVSTIYSVITLVIKKVWIERTEWQQIVDNWFEDFIYNTKNLIDGKCHYKPTAISIIFSGKSSEEIRKTFNQNKERDWLKYQYLIEIDKKEHNYFAELCNSYKIINRVGFRDFLAKENSRLHKKNATYKKYLRSMNNDNFSLWESWKL